MTRQSSSSWSLAGADCLSLILLALIGQNTLTASRNNITLLSLDSSISLFPIFCCFFISHHLVVYSFPSYQSVSPPPHPHLPCVVLLLPPSPSFALLSLPCLFSKRIGCLCLPTSVYHCPERAKQRGDGGDVIQQDTNTELRQR